MALKVLIVDDSESARVEVSDLLAQKGFECLIAENGREGLEVFAAHEDLSLIISDINMPVMGGIEMCREIQKSGRKVPIVVVSSDSLKGLKEEGKKAGVIAWIVKPIDKDSFIEGITQLTGGGA